MNAISIWILKEGFNVSTGQLVDGLKREVSLITAMGLKPSLLTEGTNIRSI